MKIETSEGGQTLFIRGDGRLTEFMLTQELRKSRFIRHIVVTADIFRQMDNFAGFVWLIGADGPHDPYYRPATSGPNISVELERD